MKQSFTKQILIVLFSVVLLAALAVFASAEATIIDSGYCGGEGDGADLTWVLDGNGTLTISGSGRMMDYQVSYDSFDNVPWKDYRLIVKSIDVQDGVTSIGSFAFSYFLSLQSVHISNSVTSIGVCSFSSCTNLPAINIPSSVIRIEESSFQGCRSIKKLYLSEGLKEIGNLAFADCHGLTSVILSDSVSTIGEYAFSFCTKLESIRIGVGVVRIGKQAFVGCSNLNSVCIDNLSAWCAIAFDNFDSSNPLSYAHILFLNDEPVTDLIIPEGVTYISDGAFMDYTNLFRVTFPESLERIGRHSFSGCTNLGQVIFGKNEKRIEDGAFLDCASLKHIELPKTVNYIGEATFSGCLSIDSLVIPNSITTIGVGAFGECKSLREVIIRAEIDFLSPGMFTQCSNLQSITIPKSLNTVYYYAFFKCYSLKDVFFGGSKEQWNDILINDGNEYLTNANIHFTDVNHVHIPAFPVIENSTVGTCVAGGTYQSVIYCSACGEEISRETIIVPAGQHTFGDWIEPKNPYASDAKRSRSCVFCDYMESESVTPLTLDKVFENMGDGVRIECADEAFDEGTVLETKHRSNSDVENDVIDEAWYIELKKEGVKVQPKVPVILKLKLPAGAKHPERLMLWHYYEGVWIQMETWIEGIYICCVTDCFSPFTFTDKGEPPTTIPPLDDATSHTHTYTAAITTDPTCTTDGETTYTCTVCGNTYTEPIPATGNHVDDNNDGKCDTCGEKMTGGKHCKYCGKIHGGLFGWLVKIFHSIFAIFKR